MMSALLEAAGLVVLATGSVALWTLRVALTATGRRLTAAVVAGIEAVSFAVAFGAVVAALNDPLRIGAYATGVALGTLLGIVTGDRLSNGQSLVTAVVDGSAVEGVGALREAGWPCTVTPASGVRGLVTILVVAVDDRRLSALQADLDRFVPGAFVTIENLRAVRPVGLGEGMHTVGIRRGRA